MPLPSEEATPPVTKTYFDISSILHDKEIFVRQHQKNMDQGIPRSRIAKLFHDVIVSIAYLNICSGLMGLLPFRISK